VPALSSLIVDDQRIVADDEYLKLQTVQAGMNAEPGPRRLPARVIPVPDMLDAKSTEMAAAPYWGPIWNMTPTDDDAWRAAVKESADQVAPLLAEARATLCVQMEPTLIGGVNAFILTPDDIPDRHKDQLVFHVHGGGYLFGTGEAGTGEAMLMAAFGGYKVVSIDYRMAPDFPHPAAMDDVVAAWRAIVATTNPKHIAIEGTSAGGGIILAMMLRLKAEGLPMPAAIAPGSPSSDLTETGDSYKTNEWLDNVLVSYGGFMAQVVAKYANGHDLRDPQLSPIYGDFHGFPPTFLTAGTRDLLLSNTVRVHRKLRQAGVVAELQIFEGMSHAQYTFDHMAPVTREAFSEIATFFDAHLST
jgi:epsilon-lactone hydrolase